jgi:hypothetical protein
MVDPTPLAIVVVASQAAFRGARRAARRGHHKLQGASSRVFARKHQRGLATVEMILVMPFVVLPILFSIFVFGRIYHTRLVLDGAAAAGARVAAVDGGSAPDVYTRIQQSLSDGGIDPSRATITVTGGGGWNEPIDVTVEITETAEIPYMATWQIPLKAEMITRSEVAP